MTIARKRAGKRSNWATPAALFARYHTRYRFTCDRAAEAWNAKLPTFFSEEQNALEQVWTGCGFTNPPYDDLWPWCAQALAATLGKERTSELELLLLPVRTDRDWFHEIVLPFARIEYLRGRVNMVPPPEWKGRNNQPAEASMIVVFERRIHAGDFGRNGDADRRAR